MSSLIFDRLRLAIFISLAFVITACSQSKQSETSSISFKLPKKISYSGQAIQEKSGDVTSQSLVAGYEIQRVIFNIRGPGIKNGILNRCWDDEGSDCLRLPSDDIYRIRELGTNNGDHLVQILVAAGKSESVDPTTGATVQVSGPNMIIYYGDNTGRLTKLSGGDIPVRINVTPTSVSQGEALIKGRYLNASGNGPTGTLDMMYNPGNGKPLMRIAESAIFAGWFNVFSLYDQSFTYQLRKNGDILIDGIQMAPSINPLVITDPQQRLLIEIPQHYDRYTDENGDPIAEVESPERLIMGFFGPGSSSTSLFACAEDDGDSAPGNMDDFYLSAAGGSLLQWDLTQAPSSSRVGRPKGGVLTSTHASQCDPSRTVAGGGSALFNEFLFLSKDMVENDLHMAGGFYGPLGVFPVGEDMEFLIIGDSGNAAGDLKIQWSYLPGVFGQSDSIDGFEFFYRTVTAADEEFIKDQFRGGPEGPPCGKKARDIGMSPIGRTSGQSQTDIVFSGIHHQNRDFVMTMCPYRISQDGKIEYFSGGAIPILPDEGNDGCETCDQHELKMVIAQASDSNPRFEWGTIIDKPMTFPKEVVSDSFVQDSWILYPTIGREGDFWSEGFSSSEIDEVSFAINGSNTFNTVSVGNLNTSASVHGRTILGIPGAALEDELAAALASVASVRFRFKVSSSVVNKYNLSSDTFTSPVINFDATCTPSSNSWGVQVTNVSNSNQFPNGIEDVAGITDSEIPLRLEYTDSSCTGKTIDIPLKTIDVLGPRCLSQEDFVSDPEAARPFDFHFSSKDSSGRDCNLSSPGHDFYFTSVFTYSGSIFPVESYYTGLAGSILHSISQYTVAPFLVSAGTSVPGTNSIILEAAHLGPGVDVNLAGFPVNTDFKPLGSASGNAGGEPIWQEKDSTQFDISITSSNGADEFAATSTDPGDNNGAQFYTLKKDGGATDEYKWAMRVKGLNQKFYKMSENFFDGGSPLILGIDESSPSRLRIWHWPDSFVHHGAYENRDLVNLTQALNVNDYITYASATELKETAHIVAYRPNNSNGRGHFVISVGHRLQFGAIDNNGQVQFSPTVSIVHSIGSDPMKIHGMVMMDNGGRDLLIYANSYVNGDSRVFRLIESNLPYFDSGSWQNMPSNLSEASAEVVGGDLSVAAANLFDPTQRPYMRKCTGEGEYAMIIGRQGSGTDVLNVLVLDNSGSVIHSYLGAPGSWDVDFNELSCHRAMRGSNTAFYLVPFSNEVAHAGYPTNIMLWDNTGSYCGSSGVGMLTYQSYSPKGTHHMGVIFKDSLVVPGALRIIHGGANTLASPIEEIRTDSCTGGGAISFDAINELGRLPVGTSSSDNLVGLFKTREEYDLPSGPGERVFIMGRKSQVYQTHLLESAP